MAASACVADRAWRPEISSRKNCGIPAPDADMLRGRIEADGRNAQKFDFAVPDQVWLLSGFQRSGQGVLKLPLPHG